MELTTSALRNRSSIEPDRLQLFPSQNWGVGEVHITGDVVQALSSMRAIFVLQLMDNGVSGLRAANLALVDLLSSLTFVDLALDANTLLIDGRGSFLFERVRIRSGSESATKTVCRRQNQ